MSQRELARSAGVTATTVRNVEGGRTFTRVPSSITAIETALGWAFGSADAVLAGGEPTLASGTLRTAADGQTAGHSGQPAESTKPPARSGTLPIGVQAALDTGETFATDIIRFPDLELIVVVKAGSYGDDEGRKNLRNAMEEWLRVQQGIRDLVPAPDTPSDQRSNI